MTGLRVLQKATENEVAAVVAALSSVLRPRPDDPLRDWRRKRRQALRMHRGA